MNDDEHDAWQMHQNGSSWEDIGIEMGCTEAAARSFAAGYEQRTDNAAKSAQNTLF